jgi:hypothetical protein
MLPEREDLTMYQTKEGLLDVIASRRIEREREQFNNENNGGAEDPLTTSGRATSVRDILNRAITIEGSREASTVYGTTGGSQNGQGSDDGSDFGDGSDQGSTSGSDSSTHQQERVRATRRDSVREAIGRYRRVFTSDTRNKSRVDESTAKERAASTGRKLSDVEAARLRPKIIEYLLWQTEHMDQLLIAITAGHEPVEIWSTIDKTDCEIIAEFMVIRGRQDARAAQAVRYLSVFIDRLKLGMIILPRMYQTAILMFTRGMSLK